MAYILNNGELMAAGTPDEVLANKSVREVYLGEGFSL
jgi:lipopolysaccharide export system ATP-binding protein